MDGEWKLVSRCRFTSEERRKWTIARHVLRYNARSHGFGVKKGRNAFEVFNKEHGGGWGCIKVPYSLTGFKVFGCVTWSTSPLCRDFECAVAFLFPVKFDLDVDFAVFRSVRNGISDQDGSDLEEQSSAEVASSFRAIVTLSRP
jgi:hypothetical protein